MVNSIITLEVIESEGEDPEKIARAVKAKIDEKAKDHDWLSCIPLEHFTNLVKKKMKENELMLYLGDPEKRDEKIREELKEINQAIKKTRPTFFIID
jgi:membrane-anchored protein YejM (alkaline phosphatase superfamily)